MDLSPEGFHLTANHSPVCILFDSFFYHNQPDPFFSFIICSHWGFDFSIFIILCPEFGQMMNKCVFPEKKEKGL